ncbi:hypothetical protein HHK36_025022 [Tetracentron sinense]|uniref:Protein MAK16 homolog n=1 Tax=Tetracentron sinense TaxID=13715 RepID=A0A835D580_TETSI|nr:hypothetical protein HHK36_025022 [Tetracentron sinense]
MQHDEVIWQVIRHNHCSFMAKITTGNFCRNPYNVTGICNRSSCPLANSRYATIRDHDGIFYLYMKTIERAHKPNELWERVKLPRNYEKALEIIDKHLTHWPKFLVHKTKQRLTKMTQMRIRMRKLALKTRLGNWNLTLDVININLQKTLWFDNFSLGTAEACSSCLEAKEFSFPLLTCSAFGYNLWSNLMQSIEKELLERLKKGVYGDIYNYPVKEYNKVLDMEGLQAVSEDEDEEEPEVEYVEGYDELEEEDDIEDFGGLAIDESLKDDDYDDEEVDAADRKRVRRGSGSDFGKLEKDEPGTKLKKKARVLVEVEHEDTDGRQKAVQ